MTNIDLEAKFQCPICMSSNQTPVDPTEGDNQEFIVDCEVCCSPVKVRITLGQEGISQIEADST